MVKGVGTLRARFRRVPQKFIDAAAPVTDRYAKRIVGDMKRTAPAKERDLIASIGMEQGPSAAGKAKANRSTFYGVTVFAGDETTIVENDSGGRFQNAKLQEAGTKNMPANPYFNINIRGNRRAYKSALTRALRKAIRRA